MLLYQRYIIKNIFLPFIMVSFIVTSLVWITQILKFLYLIDKGVKISDFFSLIILVIPSLLFILLPFITVVAVIYTYSYLNERHQLIILQSAGINNIQLAKPALLVACVTTLFSYYISTNLLPLSYMKLKSNLSFMKNNYVANIINEKTFNKVSQDVTVYIDKKLPDDTMQGIVLFDNRDYNNQAILLARYGIFKIYENNSTLQLYEGIRQVYDNNGNLTTLSFNSIILKLVNNNLSKLTKIKYKRDINEYYISELLKPDKELSKQRRTKLIAEGNQRLIWPFYNFTLTFLALSIFFMQVYNRKSQKKQIILIVLSIIVVIYLHFALYSFASKNLNFIIACYANVIMSIIISLYLYLRSYL